MDSIIQLKQHRKVALSVVLSFLNLKSWSLKGRSINSNWDTCYVTVCLHLIAMLRLLPNFSSVLPLEPWDEGWLANFRQLIRGIEGFGDTIAVTEPGRSKLLIPNVDLEVVFDDPIFHGYIGLELINCLDAFASEILDIPIRNVFSRHSPFWAFCRNIFQEWYLGDVPLHRYVWACSNSIR